MKIDVNKLSFAVKDYINAFNSCTLSELLAYLVDCEDVKEYAKRKGDDELYYEYNNMCIAIVVNMEKFC